jgi:hypothetical protein
MVIESVFHLEIHQNKVFLFFKKLFLTSKIFKNIKKITLSKKKIQFFFPITLKKVL